MAHHLQITLKMSCLLNNLEESPHMFSPYRSNPSFQEEEGNKLRTGEDIFDQQKYIRISS
jgi:hypothetical protein